MASEELQDELAKLLDDYEPDEIGEEIDETGQPTGKTFTNTVEVSAPLQAEVIDVALSQGPDGHVSRPKRDIAKATSALQLRIQGHSYDTIAQEVGYTSPQAASTAVNRALRKQANENVKDFIKLQQRRYNYLLAGVFRTALNKDDEKQIPALNAVLSVMDHMNKLVGVDKVSQGMVDSQVVMIDSESDSYVKQLNEMAQTNEIEAIREDDEEDAILREKLINTQNDGWEELDEEHGVMDVINEVIITESNQST